jgi:quercetin dioxygenase-like cupin family protein
MTDPTVQVLSGSGGVALDVLAGAGDARVVVGPHMGAAHRTMAVVDLPPGAATRTLRHPGEAVWYVVSGSGHAVVPAGEDLELDPGTMIHAGPGAAYAMQAGAEALRVVGGPSPPDRALHGGPAEALAEDSGAVRRFHRDRPSRLVPMISSDARLVVWLGVGAETANMNYVRLEPGEANVPHSHAESEDTILILEGRGTVDDLSHGLTLEFEAGDVIHVPVGLEHRVKADRGAGIVSVGGPCPADRAMAALAQQA